MGPISKKLVAAFRKFKNRKVVDLSEFTTGRKHAEDLQKTVISQKEMQDYHPVHAIYIYTQNQVSVMSEQITQLKEMDRFSKLIGPAEEEYMPSGPPWSPLTTSYFTSWAFFDAGVGAYKETIGTCILDLGRVLGMNPGLLRVIELMQKSRMGFYLHAGGASDVSVYLREFVTGEEIEAVVPTEYKGNKGDIWLVRVLPPPYPEFSEHLVFTTPYLVIRPGKGDWDEYFRRTISKMKARDEKQAYERLMKFGLSNDRRFWPEYITEAYVNNESDVIYLAGLPDVAESRPHSRVNR